MRTAVRWRAGIGVLVAALVGMGAGCGDDDEGQAAGPQLDPDPLRLEIQALTLPEGANPRPVVHFRVLDAAGAPVNLETEIANWNLGVPTATNRGYPNTVPRFTLAQLDDQGNYTSYYTSEATARAYTVPEGQTAPPTASPAVQATYMPPARVGTAAAPWPVEDLRSVGGGAYEYTMPPANVAGLDRTKTHTVAGWVVRVNANGSRSRTRTKWPRARPATAPARRTRSTATTTAVDLEDVD